MVNNNEINEEVIEECRKLYYYIETECYNECKCIDCTCYEDCVMKREELEVDNLCYELKQEGLI